MTPLCNECGRPPTDQCEPCQDMATGKRPPKKAYVVTQNGYPAAVFTNVDAAVMFAKRQPVRTAHGYAIDWRVSPFTMDDEA
jgi:hypothetical protein